MTQINVAVVAGESIEEPLILPFERFSQDFLFKVFCIQSSNIQVPLSFSSRIFENLPDMPGYMRNLEAELVNSDFILAMGLSNLSAFQAVRIARKTNKPVGILVSDFRPQLYNDFPNVKAMQADILAHADFFLAYSRTAADYLRLEGVAPKKIFYGEPMAPIVDKNQFQAGRKKFRDYINVEDSEILVGYLHPLEEKKRLETFLNAVKLLKVDQPDVYEKLRILVVGQGKSAGALKYSACDLGLGNKVMFLQQDIDPFAADLFAALDIHLVPWCFDNENEASLALKALTISCHGTIPIFPRPSMSAEYIAKFGFSYNEQTFGRIAKALTQAAEHVVEYGSYYWAEKKFRSPGTLPKPGWKEFFAGLQSLMKERNENGLDYQAAMYEIEAKIKGGLAHDALVEIEDLILADVPSTETKSDIYRLKGDSLAALSRYAEATESYQKSISFWDNNAKTYRGLGYIGLKSHAHDEALTFFKRALAVHEDDPSSLLGIGLIYRQIGLPEEALFWLEKHVGIEGKQGQSGIVALTQACLECPSLKLAAGTIERVIDSIGETPALNMTLGQIYMRLGQFDEGNLLLRKALAESS